MAYLVEGSPSTQCAGLCKGLADIEDEDDLFEIDLDLIDSVPQTQYYWNRYFTATGNALLANCLLPATDISRAIPVVSKALSSSERSGNVVMVPQAEVKQMCNPIRKNVHHLDVGSEPLEGSYHIVCRG
ncbi:unnamed protein product [Malus baccata var. baccata]